MLITLKVGTRSIPQMSGDIDPAIGKKRDALIFQHHPLQTFFPATERMVMAQGTILVDHPMARQSASFRNIRHDAADDTGGAGAAGQQSDQAIGRHTPRRYLTYDFTDRGVEGTIHGYKYIDKPLKKTVASDF